MLRIKEKVPLQFAASMTRTCNIMRTTPHRFANDPHRAQAASAPKR